MNRILLAACAIGVLICGDGIAARQRGYDLFQKALAAERADGNFQEAITLYQRVVSEARADRPLAARALLRMAECYRKLGDQRARAAYERILRDYADQEPAVTEARARLRDSAPSAPAVTAVRKVWSGPQVVPEGSVSADGRFVSYPAWESGDLGLHDLATGSDRLLTNNGYAGSEYAQGSTISRDGRRIAYAWYNGADRYELRLMNLEPMGFPRPRRLYDNPDVLFLWPFEWSPDDRWIAVWLERKDQTSQIGLVSPADGTMRILKSLDWRGVERLSFSPDGRSLAFDVVVSDTDSDERDVFVIAVDGSRERQVVDNPGHDRVMGWSPDGRTLLFASTRTGTMGLWGVPIVNGGPAGPAYPIKADVAPTSLGVTRAGTLFTIARIGSVDVQTAAVDLQTGVVLSEPASIVRGLVGISRAPDWSPDGRSLAYIATRGESGRHRSIVIRSLDTAASRELHVDLDYSGQLRWTPDGRGFVLKGRDVRGRTGIYRVDAQTGATDRLVALGNEGGNSFPEMSPDGTKLYYWRGAMLRGTPGSEYVERELGTGAERVLFGGAAGPIYPSMSPDGRLLAGVVNDEREKTTTLIVMSVANGTPRVINRAAEFNSLSNYVNWTPDGTHLIVPVRTKGTFEAMLVPVAGGTPRRLGIAVGQLGVRVHPDGRRIAFTTGRAMFELWTVENFLR